MPGVAALARFIGCSRQQQLPQKSGEAGSCDHDYHGSDGVSRMAITEQTSGTPIVNRTSTLVSMSL